MIRLEPLNDVAFTEYREQLLQRYSDSIAESWRVPPTQAEAFARLQIDSLLPDGVSTRFHQVFQILKNQYPAGTVWFSNQTGSIAYVYDLFVAPEHRRQGVGRATLERVESLVKAQDCFALSLHVFTDNAAAQKFYKTVGLRPIGTQLFKNLHYAGAA